MEPAHVDSLMSPSEVMACYQQMASEDHPAGVSTGNTLRPLQLTSSPFGSSPSTPTHPAIILPPASVPSSEVSPASTGGLPQAGVNMSANQTYQGVASVQQPEQVNLASREAHGVPTSPATLTLPSSGAGFTAGSDMYARLPAGMASDNREAMLAGTAFPSPPQAAGMLGHSRGALPLSPVPISPVAANPTGYSTGEQLEQKPRWASVLASAPAGPEPEPGQVQTTASLLQKPNIPWHGQDVGQQSQQELGGDALVQVIMSDMHQAKSNPEYQPGIPRLPGYEGSPNTNPELVSSMTTHGNASLPGSPVGRPAAMSPTFKQNQVLSGSAMNNSHAHGFASQQPGAEQGNGNGNANAAMQMQTQQNGNNGQNVAGYPMSTNQGAPQMPDGSPTMQTANMYNNMQPQGQPLQQQPGMAATRMPTLNPQTSPFPGANGSSNQQYPAGAAPSQTQPQQPAAYPPHAMPAMQPGYPPSAFPGFMPQMPMMMPPYGMPGQQQMQAAGFPPSGYDPAAVAAQQQSGGMGGMPYGQVRQPMQSAARSGASGGYTAPPMMGHMIGPSMGMPVMPSMPQQAPMQPEGVGESSADSSAGRGLTSSQRLSTGMPSVSPRPSPRGQPDSSATQQPSAEQLAMTMQQPVARRPTDMMQMQGQQPTHPHMQMQMPGGAAPGMPYGPYYGPFGPNPYMAPPFQFGWGMGPMNPQQQAAAYAYQQASGMRRPEVGRPSTPVLMQPGGPTASPQLFPGGAYQPSEPSEEEEDAAAALQAMHAEQLAAGGVRQPAAAAAAPRRPRSPSREAAGAATHTRRRSPPGGSAVWARHAYDAMAAESGGVAGVQPTGSGAVQDARQRVTAAFGLPGAGGHRDVTPPHLNGAAGQAKMAHARPPPVRVSQAAMGGPGLGNLPASEIDWLEELTTTDRFFKVCKACGGGLRLGERPSNGGRDALATLMDLDDPHSEGVCSNCRGGREARGHRLLQIRRSTYHDVVKAQDLTSLRIDLSGVQAYSINNARVVFLQPRPASKPPRGTTMPARCVLDGRQLMDAGSKYCSLRCKIDVEIHGVAPLMSNNPQDSPTAAAAATGAGLTKTPTSSGKRGVGISASPSSAKRARSSGAGTGHRGGVQQAPSSTTSPGSRAGGMGGEAVQQMGAAASALGGRPKGLPHLHTVTGIDDEGDGSHTPSSAMVRSLAGALLHHAHARQPHAPSTAEVPTEDTEPEPEPEQRAGIVTPAASANAGQPPAHSPLYVGDHGVLQTIGETEEGDIPQGMPGDTIEIPTGAVKGPDSIPLDEMEGGKPAVSPAPSPRPSAIAGTGQPHGSDLHVTFAERAATPVGRAVPPSPGPSLSTRTGQTAGSLSHGSGHIDGCESRSSGSVKRKAVRVQRSTVE